jgi:hypothetical protein
VTSGVVEIRCDLNDTSWPRRPIVLTKREVRALVERRGGVHITEATEPYIDMWHTGLPARFFQKVVAVGAQRRQLR